STERELYARWEEAGVFTADAARSKRVGGDRDPFTIVIPPPNVTAVLHMGHGLDDTVQDVIVRWRRMAGDETLWVPGTDHAGIATQNVVERALAAEGKTRFDLGREAFVKRTEAFVEKTGGTILQQLRAIGASCDWTRTAYTLSPELSVVVREVFVTLFERGLIYRGHRVIHWCPRCLTSLSDEEAEHAEEEGTLHYVRYALAEPVNGRPAHITVATTRPETILGDVAIAVHPEDERYASLVGRNVLNPLLGTPLPVIADYAVDPEFGTGALKITPAHDHNDFEIGLRQSLSMPSVILPDGTIGEDQNAEGRIPAELRGLDRVAARTRSVEMLEKSGALEKVKKHSHAIRHCYRCDTVVEPRLSDQWFVSMKPLAEPALAAVRNREIRILPERWEAVYVNWLEGIRDWNISRQLWWGHRIPVWYCDRCPDPIVSRTTPEKCPTCGGAVTQDEDVLDTWFSSWLWPFSTLGWPDKNAMDLRAFYPTDVLVSAPDILFFWIARMVMAGYEFVGASPFHTIYLHGLARDTQHRKMSKMLGNGIDPLDVVDRFGADALRYTVISGLGMGADIIMDPSDLEKTFGVGRNFATKLWNIGRFLLSNIGEESVVPLSDIPDARLTLADRWILGRLDVAIDECDAALGPPRPTGAAWSEAELRAGLRLSEYAETARRFVWNELADWYVETTKSRLAEPGEDREVARAVLVHVFDDALRLLHPIVPFITEALWQRLPGIETRASKFLASSKWPRRGGRRHAEDFEKVRDAVVALRQIRADYNIPPAKILAATIVARADGAVYQGEVGLIGRLARAEVSVSATAPEGAAAHVVLRGGAELVAPLAGIVDVEKECRKLKTELDQLEKQLAQLGSRLASESFTARAPAHVVEAERAKEKEWLSRREMLSTKVESLCG
ncbi:MAG TPA: valine--tRNA ligase, partial [Gemmatimonadaceae bacterium]|nr:valine--tRNA ligase [Gemmatimonadaceae bacterium]